MLSGRKVYVIVPAFNEAPRIARMLKSVPAFVDRVFVVDDASRDETSKAARATNDPRVEVILHAQNRGVGAAIYTGYARAIEDSSHAHDAFAVMAGDGQMDPDDLENVVRPIVVGDAGYVKGNRFRHESRRAMPLMRYLGGRTLSTLTSLAVGHPIEDSQCGYTAISRVAAQSIDMEIAWKGYGYPNDLFARLVENRVPIEEVVVRAVYGDEESKLRIWHIARIFGVVAAAGLRRVSR